MCAPMIKEDQQPVDPVKKMMTEEGPTNPIAKNYVRLYRSMPVINFPFTNLDISFTIFGALFLYSCRVSYKMILMKIFGWNPVDEAGMLELEESVGSLTAMTHSLSLVPGLFVALTSQPYRITGHINTAPLWWQDFVSALLQFCTGYMVYDAYASYFALKGFSGLGGTDFMFLGHHLATTIYMTQCRVLQAGHTSAMICMFLGEFTNPFQNSHIFATNALSNACCNGALMQQFHQVVEMLFAVSYFSIRGFIAPVFFAHASFQLLFESTRKNIPFFIRVVWVALIWAVEAGSMDWIVHCWEIIKLRFGLEASGESVSSSEL